MSIKSPRDEEGEGPPQPLSILDSVKRLPRRKLKSSGQKVDHPEYELLDVLGEGGMGVVWDARQISIDRSVAVKMIQSEQAQKSLQRKKFLAEAVVTGDLDHPNIVPIYDVGTDFKGKLFYAMKRVQGTPWLHLIKGNSLHENLQVLLRVADAVAFAHARGIIHRDIKPENVMLGEFGEVLLMDWGLALPTEDYRKAEKLEFSGGLAGTPAYMAPEMAAGPIEKIGTASDVYLLGATLFQVVTGKPPHSAPDIKACLIAAMRNNIEETDEEGELLDVAMKAMAKEPEDRYETVREFQSAIQGYLEHEESLSLASRARRDLETAETSGDYRDYARAVFGFEEAHALWPGNENAEAGINDAKLAYAQMAYRKENYDLGLSLLDPDLRQHRDTYRRLSAAHQEQRARTRRLRTARRLTIAMAAVLLIGALGFAYHFNRAAETERIQGAKISQQNTALTKSEADLKQANTDLRKRESDLQQANTDLRNSQDELKATNTELQLSESNLMSANADLTETNVQTRGTTTGDRGRTSRRNAGEAGGAVQRLHRRNRGGGGPHRRRGVRRRP